MEAEIVKMIITSSDIGFARVSGWIYLIPFSWKHSIYVKVVNRIILKKKKSFPFTHCNLQSLKIFGSSVWMFHHQVLGFFHQYECSMDTLVFFSFYLQELIYRIFTHVNVNNLYVENMHSLKPLFQKTCSVKSLECCVQVCQTTIWYVLKLCSWSLEDHFAMDFKRRSTWMFLMFLSSVLWNKC